MKDKKILYGIILFIIFLLSIGLTYAYFNVTTSVIGDRNDIKASVGTLNILYTDGPEIVAKSIQPGWTTTKTITIENTGSLNTSYSIEWADLTNEIINDELVMSATCVQTLSGSVNGTCSGINEEPVATSTGSIVHNIDISSGYKHTYVITFEFKEISSAQNYNQGKAFNGKINILGETYTLAGVLYDSNGDPIVGAEVEIHSNPKYATTDSEGNFEVEGLEAGEHTLIVTSASDVTLATDSISLTSGNESNVSGKKITASSSSNYAKVSITLNESSINSIGLIKTLAGDILSKNTIYNDNVASDYVSSSSGIDFKLKSSHVNGQGLYKNSKLEDGKTIYFRGGTFCGYTNYQAETTTGTNCIAAGGTWSSYTCSLSTNRQSCQDKGFVFYELKNNVTFAGHNWKIIRLDEQGNVKLIYADNTSLSSAYYNTITGSITDNSYVDYMYGDKALWGDNLSSATSNVMVSSSNVYYYGTSYSRDGSNRYYLTGDLVSGNWNTDAICSATTCPMINYYTCMNTSSTGTCTSVYKITGFNSSSMAYAKAITYGSTSYELAHQNVSNSVIKTAVDTWYSNNLSSYTKYIANGGFCSDRSLSSGSGYGTITSYYGPYTRNYSDATASPKINCTNSARDLFTMAGSTIGNKALIKPIGLISVDEARYAGYVYYAINVANYNFVNYLSFHNSYYWTMSPYNFSANPNVFYINDTSGAINNDRVNTSSYKVRPVIYLKSDTPVTSGTGAFDSPYVIN